jgi:uncharacterized protein GlcG (DUF336 family)
MKFVTFAALAMIGAAPAMAQTTAPAPATPPPGAPMAPPAPPAPGPSLAAAWTAAQAAIATCVPDRVSVTVLDSAGVERLVARSDGAAGRGPEMSRRKANTAFTFGKPSMEVRDAAKTNTALADRLKADPKLLAFGGGLPIMRDGKLFGAIAVAGGSSQDLDQKCAAAGLATLK